MTINTEDQAHGYRHLREVDTIFACYSLMTTSPSIATTALSGPNLLRAKPTSIKTLKSQIRRSLERIVVWRESLRTTFAFIDGQPIQRFGSEEDSRFHLIEHDLRECGDAQVELDP